MRRRFLIAISLCLLPAPSFAAGALPPSDQRARTLRTHNSERVFPTIHSRTEWERRAEDIRRQILVSAGLWPMPEKSPLNAHISGRAEHEGYTVEKVHLQPYPGVYLAGNLYRPAGRGPGPFPAVLVPHGHWNQGRIVHSDEASVPAACIHFARHGMVAFAYDLAGYHDTFFQGQALDEHGFGRRHRLFASERRLALWGVSLMGLQTWNSIHALDFVESLPDVDRRRIAASGASGGATQAFVLGAIDDRIAATAPAVMVSHSMQGGCVCENLPGLRIDFSNMEIAAALAPRPQILVAATGDWTRTTQTIEGPAIERIYRLLRAGDHFAYATLDSGHNFNQPTREAIYEWFGRWLLRHPNPASLIETSFEPPPPEALRVWPEGRLPEDALSEAEFTQHLVQSYRHQVDDLRPSDRGTLRDFRNLMLPAWETTLKVETPRFELIVESAGQERAGNHTARRLFLGREGSGDRIPAIHYLPNRSSIRFTVILAHPDGKSAWLDASGNPTGLAKTLIDQQQGVLLIDTFLTGDLRDEEAAASRNHFAGYFTAYNRTDTQERVQDLITAGAYAQRFGRAPRVVLAGFGRAGLWSLLASPAFDAVAADCDRLDLSDEESLLAQDIFVPGLLRIGGFEAVAALGTPRPLLLHNTGKAFPSSWLQQVYQDLRAPRSFRAEPGSLREPDVADWIFAL